MRNVSIIAPETASRSHIHVIQIDTTCAGGNTFLLTSMNYLWSSIRFAVLDLVLRACLSCRESIEVTRDLLWKALVIRRC